ncbi:hypothetical protein [Streptomyces alfalfae]|uniref:hypothetical protein n=1 Tax=Streptomyces alfalfae TaxID=1642299 RepID=UPI002811F09F|nr:hypothetical protein [Streptomyces alfalfae]
MPTQNDDFRAFSYWPSQDERRIVAMKRSPEVDAMTDEQLVARHRAQDAARTTRVVSREEENGDRIIAVMRRDEETDRMSDEEILAKLDEWKRSRRHLRAVDDDSE